MLDDRLLLPKGGNGSHSPTVNNKMPWSRRRRVKVLAVLVVVLLVVIITHGRSADKTRGDAEKLSQLTEDTNHSEKEDWKSKFTENYSWSAADQSSPVGTPEHKTSLDTLIQSNIRLKQEVQTLETKLSSCNQSKGHAEHVKDGTHNSHPQHVVIISLISTGEVPKFRELVGSLHSLRQNVHDVHQMIVYGFGLTHIEKREISLWRNVDYFDETDLMRRDAVTVHTGHDEVSSTPKDRRLSESLLLNAFEINLRKYGTVLYISADVMFEQDTLHKMIEIVERDGYFSLAYPDVQLNDLSTFDYQKFLVLGLKDFTKAANLFVGFELQCLRGYQCDSVFKRALKRAQVSLVQKHQQAPADFHIAVFKGNPVGYFCNLLLRDDIIYPFDIPHSGHAEETKQSTRTKVAFGMPTMSVAESYEKIAPIRLFLPSFFQTVAPDEWAKYRYVYYIGYDEGDKFFDDATTRQQILDNMVDQVKKNAPADAEVVFELVRFPYSKGWVTYLWNGLFIHAMKDGCDYYYQVNDDLVLKGAGWTTLFVETLQKQDNYGVVGPTDNRHGNNLLTQSFTSRKHFEIFGYYYPMEIKDWYSDNWISTVYDPHLVRHVEGVNADNVNDAGTRYNFCDNKDKYERILAEGKVIVKQYFENLQLKKEDEEDEKNNIPISRRLQRQLQQGPVMQ